MDIKLLTQTLSGLAPGGLRYFEQTGSTNEEAARWAEAGALDLALVVADEQTAGRGRQGRRWFTPPGAALAFSLVLRPQPGAEAILPEMLSRLTGLGAVAVVEALQQEYGLEAQIKWPNDVLLAGRKTCGILSEAHWQGERLLAVILGIGVNVTPASVPNDAALIFPATCVESVLGEPVERDHLLAAILRRLLDWRPRLMGAEFMHTWEKHLAYRGEWVTLLSGTVSQPSQKRLVQALGLDEHGALRIRLASGDEESVLAGEVRLRQDDSGGHAAPPGTSQP